MLLICLLNEKLKVKEGKLELNKINSVIFT